MTRALRVDVSAGRAGAGARGGGAALRANEGTIAGASSVAAADAAAGGGEAGVARAIGGAVSGDAPAGTAPPPVVASPGATEAGALRVRGARFGAPSASSLPEAVAVRRVRGVAAGVSPATSPSVGLRRRGGLGRSLSSIRRV